MAKTEAAPFDPQEFASAEEALNAICAACTGKSGWPETRENVRYRADRARRWLIAAVACAQEREGIMTRREVLEGFCEADYGRAQAPPEDRAYDHGRHSALSDVLGLWCEPLQQAIHALALAMNADRAQEAKA